jgi:hypothetical protein
MRQQHCFTPHLLPSDAWNRSSDGTSSENHRLSLFHVDSSEALDKLWSDHLLLLDHMKLALEACLARLVAGDAGDLSSAQTQITHEIWGYMCKGNLLLQCRHWCGARW